jgi:hypothetical protein
MSPVITSQSLGALDFLVGVIIIAQRTPDEDLSFKEYLWSPEPGLKIALLAWHSRGLKELQEGPSTYHVLLVLLVMARASPCPLLSAHL